MEGTLDRRAIGREIRKMNRKGASFSRGLIEAVARVLVLLRKKKQNVSGRL